MPKDRNWTGRWFMAATLSALVHGFLILALITGWSLLHPSTSNFDPTTESLNKPFIFWDNDNKAVKKKDDQPGIVELAPFTAHLIPIAIVNTSQKTSDPARSLITKLRTTDSQSTRASQFKLPRPNQGRVFSSLNIGPIDEKLGILIDRSLSMGTGGAWNQILQESDDFLPVIQPDRKVRIWLFDKDCEEIARSDDWGPWNEIRLGHALRRIHETRPGGLTNLANAIRTAVFRGSTRVLVVSDDADITISDWISITATLRRLNKSTPKLCALRIAKLEAENDVLLQICQQTGGWCGYPNQR